MPVASPTRLSCHDVALSVASIASGLPDFPLNAMSMRGSVNGFLSWRLDRGQHNGTPSTQVAADGPLSSGAFDRALAISGEPPMDNSTTYYLLSVLATTGVANTDVYGGSIRYVA